MCALIWISQAVRPSTNCIFIEFSFMHEMQLLIKLDTTQVLDSGGGYFYNVDDRKCSHCKKWEYAKLSCESQNKDADDQDCHLFGESKLDKKCFTKRIEKGESFASMKIFQLCTPFYLLGM